MKVNQPGINFSDFFTFLNFSLLFLFACESLHLTNIHNITTKTIKIANVMPIANPKVEANCFIASETQILHYFATMLNSEKPQKYKLSDQLLLTFVDTQIYTQTLTESSESRNPVLMGIIKLFIEPLRSCSMIIYRSTVRFADLYEPVSILCYNLFLLFTRMCRVLTSRVVKSRKLRLTYEIAKKQEFLQRILSSVLKSPITSHRYMPAIQICAQCSVGESPPQPVENLSNPNESFLMQGSIKNQLQNRVLLGALTHPLPDKTMLSWQLEQTFLDAPQDSHVRLHLVARLKGIEVHSEEAPTYWGYDLTMI